MEFLSFACGGHTIAAGVCVGGGVLDNMGRFSSGLWLSRSKGWDVLIKFKETDVLDDLSWSCVKGESCKQKPE